MKKAISAVALALAIGNAQAGTIDVFEFSSLINADEIAGDSLLDRQLYNPSYLSPANEFGANGLSVTFTNNLGADNTGSVSWVVTNNTGGSLNNVQFFGFLDAEIDEPLNTYFNESGDASSLVLGSGSGDAMADSWGIGDPFLDNIFQDLLDGSLTNTNTVPAGAESDVSLALGFDVGTLDAGESFGATFDISLADNGGLMHFDPNSDGGQGFGFYFNGAIMNLNNVPEPATLSLLGLGLLGFRLFSKRT
jgi:hypothetical protein